MSILTDRSLPGRRPARRLAVRPDLETAKRTIADPLAAVAFWSAIALPALYLPLVAAGIETPPGLVTFLGLFGLHVVSLVAGRSHRAA